MKFKEKTEYGPITVDGVEMRRFSCAEKGRFVAGIEAGQDGGPYHCWATWPVAEGVDMFALGNIGPAARALAAKIKAHERTSL